MLMSVRHRIYIPVTLFGFILTMFLCGVSGSKGRCCTEKSVSDGDGHVTPADMPVEGSSHCAHQYDRKISPYDGIFRQQAAILGWDWRLLAAMAWNESHFNPQAISQQGAVGIMQLMPRTAARFGLAGDSMVYDPESNIEAGVRYLKRLDAMFSSVKNPIERVNFILAGYNAGPGHVFDAMRLAGKYGADPYKWYGNVDIYILKLSEEKYYSDSACHHGFFRGGHTVRYIDDVYAVYYEYAGIYAN